MKTQLKNVKYSQRFRLARGGQIMQIFMVQAPENRKNGTVKVLVGETYQFSRWEDWNKTVEVVDDMTPSAEVADDWQSE